MADWDAVAAEVGLPVDWRELGYDSPEYMVEPDSLYAVHDDDHQPTGVLKCVWPRCDFRRRDVEQMFRHVHDETKHRAIREKGEQGGA